MKPKSLVASYLSRAEKYPTLRLILEFSILAFVLKIISALIFANILLALGFQDKAADIQFTEDLLKQSIVWAFVSIPIFASIETLIGQWFFTFLVSRFTKNKAVIITISAIAFDLLHADAFQIAAIWPIGFILSWVFVTKRTEGRWKALWVTTSIHSLHNALSTYLILIALPH